MHGGNSSFNKASINPYVTDREFEENDNVSSETGTDSPSSTTFNDIKLSPKKGRRSLQKRILSVPIKDVEGYRYKGESAPPSDSWAWRKYGQKPIKGSPYPRGYYRCSTSKGCPAKKQVERSRVDPKTLVITYSCEHNHPWPPSRNNSASSKRAAALAEAASEETEIATVTGVETEPSSSQQDAERDSGNEEQRFADLTDESIIGTGDDEFAWFVEMETTSSTVLESPLFSERYDNCEADVAVVFPVKEEDESLFADLGELPECSFVFRRQRNVGPEVGIC